MRDILISAIVAVLAVLCLFIFVFMAKESKNTQDILTKIELEVSEHRREKKKLEIELAELEKKHLYETVGMSRLVFCFRDADSIFIEDILPVLNNNNIPAVMCISEENMPGVTSLLSIDDYNSLIEDGWQSAVILDSDKSISEWYEELKLLFENSEIDIPSVVLINDTDFSTSVAYELYSLGFVDIILKATKPDIFRTDLLDGPCVTDAVGWYTYGASDIIELFASNVGDAVFVIGGNAPDEEYIENQFNLMLNTIMRAIEKKQLFFTTPHKMAEYKNDLIDAYNNTIDEYNEKRSVLKEEIKKLDATIESIYGEYLYEE